MEKFFAVILLAMMTLPSVRADKTVRFDYQTSEARTIDVYPSTYIQPLVAEVVVDTKTGRIHDTWTLSAVDFESRRHPNDDMATIQNLRAYGLFKSSEKHNCDLIVAATFDIKISDQGVIINLVGYPANFDNWSTATKADYNWINIERGDKTVAPEENGQEKKK